MESTEERTKRWRFQSQVDDCWPTDVYNILADLGSRQGQHHPPLSYRYLREVMEYGRRGWGAFDIPMGRVVEKLDKVLVPLGYRVEEASNQSFGELVKIVEDGALSLPLAGVSSEYFSTTKVARSYDIIEEPVPALDHVLIILKADDQTITAFDSFARFGKGGTGIPGIVEVGTPHFMSIWNEARSGSQWLMFIRLIPEKEKKREGLKTLDQYGESK